MDTKLTNTCSDCIFMCIDDYNPTSGCICRRYPPKTSGEVIRVDTDYRCGEFISTMQAFLAKEDSNKQRAKAEQEYFEDLKNSID